MKLGYVSITVVVDIEVSKVRRPQTGVIWLYGQRLVKNAHLLIHLEQVL